MLPGFHSAQHLTFVLMRRRFSHWFIHMSQTFGSVPTLALVLFSTNNMKNGKCENTACAVCKIQSMWMYL